MELQEVLAYFQNSPQGVVMVGIIIKGNLPKDQYLSDILITIFINFSLISGLVYFQNPLKFLDLGMLLDPQAVI